MVDYFGQLKSCWHGCGEYRSQRNSCPPCFKSFHNYWTGFWCKSRATQLSQERQQTWWWRRWWWLRCCDADNTCIHDDKNVVIVQMITVIRVIRMLLMMSIMRMLLMEIKFVTSTSLMWSMTICLPLSACWYTLPFLAFCVQCLLYILVRFISNAPVGTWIPITTRARAIQIMTIEANHAAVDDVLDKQIKWNECSNRIGL